MTAWDLFAILRRNLIVIALGLVLTVLAVGYLVKQPGVYSSRVSLVLEMPVNPRSPELVAVHVRRTHRTCGCGVQNDHRADVGCQDHRAIHDHRG